jgi:broad specificity phosphatase PhoE
MHPTRLLLVRHGRTEWNATRRVLGRTDIPLDEVGVRQASLLAGSLPAFDACYTSPLSRAAATAAQLRGPAPIPDPDLMEMDQGALEGLDPGRLLAEHGLLVAAWRADPSSIDLPGGEPYAALQRRAASFLARVAERHRGATVCVVTHQLWISAALCGIAGAPPSEWRRYTHRNTAWTDLTWADPPRVVAHDVGPHLDE